MRKGDERDALALEGRRVVLRVAVEQLPLVVAFNNTLVRGPEVAARVFS